MYREYKYMSIYIYSCLNNVCIYHININVNTVYIYIRICVVSLTSDFGSLLREALRAILSGNQPFNLDQKIHVFWTTFSRCKCFQGKQDNEAYPNSEKSGNFLTLANPKGFFQWSNPPNSEKSSEISKIPKKKWASLENGCSMHHFGCRGTAPELCTTPTARKPGGVVTG